MSMSRNLMLRLQEAMLGGDLPEAAKTTGTTKTAQLAALGWGILPLPRFWGSRELWHNSENTDGNPAVIDFKRPREWLVIPPDDTGIQRSNSKQGSSPVSKISTVTLSSIPGPTKSARQLDRSRSLETSY